MTDLPPTREKHPTAAKGFLYLIVLALVGAGITGFALTQRSADGPKVPTAAPTPLAVTVTPAAFQTRFELKEQFAGIATASRASDLGFTAGGRIDRLTVDVGDRVRRGQVLASLDTRSLRAQLRAAEAAVEEAEASADVSAVTLRRQETLLDQGHVTAQRVDEASAQSQAAQARVLSAKAQADTLRVQIDLSTITAPYDGVITDRMADEGVIAGPSQPILRLVESGPVEARIGLPADIAARLEPGEEYTLMLDEAPLSATLRSATGVIDARSRTVATVFEVAADQNVPSGSVVRLSMDETIDEAGVWVPVSALTEVSRGVWSLLVAEEVEGETLARPRPVTIVHTDGTRAYARGVIEDGDLIILEGLQRIAPNQPVLPREAAYARRPASAEE